MKMGIAKTLRRKLTRTAVKIGTELDNQKRGVANKQSRKVKKGGFCSGTGRVSSKGKTSGRA